VEEDRHFNFKGRNYEIVFSLSNAYNMLVFILNLF